MTKRKEPKMVGAVINGVWYEVEEQANPIYTAAAFVIAHGEALYAREGRAVITSAEDVVYVENTTPNAPRMALKLTTRQDPKVYVVSNVGAKQPIQSQNQWPCPCCGGSCVSKPSPLE